MLNRRRKKYRDDLTPNFGHIAILIVGGSVDAAMSAQYKEADLQFLSYKSIISKARVSLDWLIKELASN